VVVAPPPPPYTLAFEAEVEEEAAPAPPPPVVNGGGGGGAPAAVASSSSSSAPAATPLPAIPAFSITREFDGATVFLTGATGFLGSVLLEQLLRCTDVAAVHCLVRARSGSSAKKRFKALLADKLFARVRAAKPGAPAKVFLVEGNAAAPFLGTQPGELDALAPRLDFILNVAAQVTPHAHIRTAVSVNAGSAQRVVALAAACPHLKALVHVSSAYVASMAPGSAPLKGEVLYPLPAMGDDGGDDDGAPHPASVDAVLDCLRDASPAAAAEMGAAMMADAGLTDQYVVSKLLAEHVVTDGAAAANLPAIIVRPSFIAPAAGPPVEGYFIGRAGGMALASLSAVEYGSLLPAGVGVEDVEAARICIVPVDIVAASIMAAAASTAVRAREVGPAHHPAPTPIINICTSGTPSPLTVGAASAAMAGLSGVAKAILKKTLPGKDSLAGLIAGEYLTIFGRLVTEAESREAGLAMVRALRFECGGLMALEASLAPAEHVLFPLQWGERPVGCVGGAPPGTTTVLGGRTWASTINASQTYAAQLFKSR
jgi:thioester reductase-like protein